MTALKLAEKNPAYLPILSLFWGFVGPELTNMDATEKQRYLEKSIENGPADAGALAELSSMVQKSDPAKAIDLLKRSLALSPSPDNYYHLAVLENQAGTYRDAVKAIELADRFDVFMDLRQRACPKRDRRNFRQIVDFVNYL